MLNSEQSEQEKNEKGNSESLQLPEEFKEAPAAF